MQKILEKTRQGLNNFAQSIFIRTCDQTLTPCRIVIVGTTFHKLKFRETGKTLSLNKLCSHKNPTSRVKVQSRFLRMERTLDEL